MVFLDEDLIFSIASSFVFLLAQINMPSAICSVTRALGISVYVLSQVCLLSSLFLNLYD
uniref:Uncharacterized protein n=1 Tax=Rhizophora mucronata TaxID=61149 RepID=A0A2P2J850_RHIMU